MHNQPAPQSSKRGMKILHLRPEAWQFERKRLELRKYKAKHSDLYTARWRPGPAAMVDQPMRHIKFEIVVIQNLYIYHYTKKQICFKDTQRCLVATTVVGVRKPVVQKSWTMRQCCGVTTQGSEVRQLDKGITQKPQQVQRSKSAEKRRCVLGRKDKKICMNGQGMLVGSSAFWVIGYFVTPTHRARTREKRRRSQSFLLARTTKQWRKSMSHKKAGK